MRRTNLVCLTNKQTHSGSHGHIRKSNDKIERQLGSILLTAPVTYNQVGLVTLASATNQDLQDTNREEINISDEL